MLVTELYKGQGLGNQLWTYVTTRVIALQKNYKFGIKSPENFKGLDFMNLDFGEKVIGGSGPDGGPPINLPENISNYYCEKKIIHPLNGSEIRLFDNDLINVPDNTKIDGLMQDEQYIIHHKNEIRKWLKVKDEYEFYDFSKDNICIINFRGTGYVNDRDFFLTKEYWRNAINNMRKINPQFKFIVITEDVKNAKKFFPNFEVYHFSIAKDYVVIKNAKYLILSNSSFAWFPAWLNENLKYCIAPKYWARHNISDGYWSLGYNITSGWLYQDRNGKLQSYGECLTELKKFIKENPEIFKNTEDFKPTAAKIIKKHIDIFNIYKKESGILQSLYLISNLISSKIKVEIRSRLWKLSIQVKKTKIMIFIKRIVKRFLYFINVQYKTVNRGLIEYRAKRHWLSPKQISEYRKKIKIYDAFNFFNELELLEIRLNILNNYVDYFVIVESTLTHSGLPKELFFEKNKHLFKKFEKKIIHYVIENPLKGFADAKERLLDSKTSDIEKEILKNALTSDNVGPGKENFLRDFYEKESVKIPLEKLSDSDFCFVSDLDEIWNPKLLIDYSKDDVFKPLQDNYVYYLNNRSNEIDGWTGTIGTKYKNIKNNCLNHLRTLRKMKTKYVFLSNGGWHFTFQGGAERILKKIESYSHQELNNSNLKSKIIEKMLNNEDIRGKTVKFWKDDAHLPSYLIENKQKYIKLFR